MVYEIWFNIQGVFKQLVWTKKKHPNNKNEILHEKDLEKRSRAENECIRLQIALRVFFVFSFSWGIPRMARFGVTFGNFACKKVIRP